jgi:hypothetical protein
MVLSQFLLKSRKPFNVIIEIMSTIILVLSYIAGNLFFIACSAFSLYIMPELGVYRESDPSPLSTSVMAWVLVSVVGFASHYVTYRCLIDNIKNDEDFDKSKINFTRLFYVHSMFFFSSFFSTMLCLLIADANRSDLGNASYMIWCAMTLIDIIIIEYAYATGKKARSM